MRAESDILEFINGLSPIAVDIVRLFESFLTELEKDGCDIQNAFHQALSNSMFPNIHLTSYKPFPLKASVQDSVHFSDVCTDECEFHNDFLRILYAHISAYFILTSWKTVPLLWGFAIRLLVAVYSSCPLPHSVATESPETFAHAKYKIPLSPHIIRQIRLFAEFALQWEASATRESTPLPVLSIDETQFVVESIVALHEGSMYRITPSTDTWYAEELDRVHDALSVPISTQTLSK